MYTYVPTLAPYAQSLGASYFMVGLIVGSYGFIQLLARIPIGVYSDAWGNRKIFVVGGVALAVLSGLGMWVVPVAVVLLICRALSGLAASAWVDYTVLFASYYPAKDAPKAIGFINSVSLVGQVAGMLAGGMIAEYYGLASPFLLGALGGCVGLLLSLTAHEERTQPRPVNTAVLMEAFRDPDLLRLSGLAIIVQVITYATIFGFSPVAAKALGASAIELGLLATVAIVPSIFSSALSGTFFVRRFGERGTLIWGLIGMGLSCLVIPFIGDLVWFYWSQAIGGFCRGLLQPLLMGLSIKNFSGEKRSTAMGVYQAGYGIGMCGGPIITGILAGFFGLEWGFWFIGVVGLIGAGMAGWRRYLPLSG